MLFTFSKRDYSERMFFDQRGSGPVWSGQRRRRLLLLPLDTLQRRQHQSNGHHASGYLGRLLGLCFSILSEVEQNNYYFSCLHHSKDDTPTTVFKICNHCKCGSEVISKENQLLHPMPEFRKKSTSILKQTGCKD